MGIEIDPKTGAPIVKKVEQPVQKIPAIVRNENKSRKEIVLEKIQAILAEHGGLESNIPARRDHEYWGLINEYRSL
jgi:hypothetical protein